MPIDWKMVQNNSKYQSLSYDQQLLINQQLVLKEVQDNPRWNQLPERAKAEIITQASTRQPAFKNPGQDTMEIMDIANRLQQGDEEAGKEAINRIGWNAFQDQLSILDALDWVGDKFTNMVNRDSAEYQQIKQSRDNRDRDAEKAMNYLEMVANNDQKYAKNAQTAATVGNIGGFIVDFASWWGATAPIAKGVKALTMASNLGKQTGMFAGKFSGAGGKAITSGGKRFFWQTAVPEVAQNTRAGMIGVLRENINGTIEKRIEEDPTWANAAWENTKLFGEYFLGDMLFFSGIQAMKVMKGGMKGIFGRGYQGKKIGKEMVGDDEFNEIVESLIQRGGLNKESIATLPIKKQEKLRKIALGAQRARNVKDLTKNPQELISYYMKGKGYDINWNATKNKWDIEDIANDKIKSFNTFEEATQRGLRWADSKLRPSMRDPDDLATYMAGTEQMNIEEYITASTSGLNVNTKGMTKLLEPDNAGFLKPQNVQFTANRVLKQTGVTDDVAKQIEIKRLETDEYFKKDITHSGNTIEIPKQIVEPKQEQKFIKKFVKDLEEMASENGGSFRRFRNLGDEILQIKKKAGYSPYWVKYAAEELGDGRIIREADNVKFERGGVIEAQGSMEDVGRYLFRNYAFNRSSDSALSYTKKYLWKEHGMKLTEGKDGRLRLLRRTDDGRMQREHYDSLDEMFESNPIYQPDLPVDAMPDLNITNAASGRFEIRNNVISGHPNLVRDFMQDFKDYKTFSETIPLKLSDGNIVSFNKKRRMYRIKHPETGVVYQKKSLDDVKKFLNKGIKSYEDLDVHARYKGARVHPYKGEYIIYRKGDETPFIARNLDEAKQKIADLDPAEYAAKELTELSDEAISDLQFQFRNNLEETAFQASFQEVANKIAKEGESTGGQIRGRTDLLNLVAPTDIMMTRMAKEANLPELYDYWKAVEQGRSRFNGAYANFKKELNRVTGRISKEENRRLGLVLLSEADEPEWGNVYRKMFGENISDRELKILERVRSILGRSPEEGLFALFGVDGYKFVNKYFPRVKRANLDYMANLNTNGEKALKKVLGYTELPRELKFFAEKMRTDDVIHSTFAEGLTEVIDLYARQGFKRTHLDPAWENMNRWWTSKSNAQRIPAEVSNRVKVYLEEIIGMTSNPTQRFIESGTRKMTHKIFTKLEKMGLMKNADQKVTDDIVSLMNRFTIGSMMSFKAWLPIRNAFQPFLTLAPRVGNDAVLEGIKRAARNGDEIVTRLKRQGRIPDKAPIMQLTGADGQFLIDKFNHAGMYAYQNSDAWTRAVADQTADVLMRDAGERFIRGDINEKQFLSLAEIDVLGDFQQKAILDELRKGNFEQAKDMFADILTWETMFPYKAGTNPALFQGTFGRIFGGFGHFPVYFTSNVVRGLKNSPMSKKMRFASRLVGNSLGLYTAFNEVLGIDPKAFLFTQPLSFTGGPYFDLLNTALTATDTTYYEGAIARSQLMDKLGRTLIPGSSAYLNFQEGLKELEKGNTHGFIINALSAPLSENF